MQSSWIRIEICSIVLANDEYESQKVAFGSIFRLPETMTLLFVAVWFATLHAQRMLETIQYNALMQFYSDAGVNRSQAGE